MFLYSFSPGWAGGVCGGKGGMRLLAGGWVGAQRSLVVRGPCLLLNCLAVPTLKSQSHNAPPPSTTRPPPPAKVVPECATVWEGDREKLG